MENNNSKKLPEGNLRKAMSSDSVSKITSREIEVLRLIADGCSNKEIAKRLNISVRTVETHRKNLMQKLNVKSVAGLIKYSIANNFTKIK